MKDLEKLVEEAVERLVLKDVKPLSEATVTLEKYCSGCSRMLPHTAFNKRNDRSSADRYGLLSKCRECLTAKSRQYYYENQEKLKRDGRRRQYKRRHGDRITDEEIERLLDSKVGICEICRKETELHLDHNHRTEARRGFICRRCNSVLGLVDDDIFLLIELTRYLSFRGGR